MKAEAKAKTEAIADAKSYGDPGRLMCGRFRIIFDDEVDPDGTAEA